MQISINIYLSIRENIVKSERNIYGRSTKNLEINERAEKNRWLDVTFGHTCD